MSNFLPDSKTIHDWKIVFDTDVRDKYVRMFKTEFKKLVLEKPTISEEDNYLIRGIAMPLFFHIAGVIDGKKVLVTNNFGNVDRYTLKNGENHYYFVYEDYYVEFNLEDWDEKQAADFGIII